MTSGERYRAVSIRTDAVGSPSGIADGTIAEGHAPRSAGPELLDYYLDEFTFRFNRRKFGGHDKFFFRLLQAVLIEPVPCKSMVKRSAVEASPVHKVLGVK